MNDLSVTWRNYFVEFYEGMGTTYERFVLHGMFEKIRNEFRVKTVLEGPAFGITGISGINSMWWAAQGIDVTVVDDNSDRVKCIREVWRDVGLPVEVKVTDDYESLSFDGERFDLGWNFCALGSVRDPDKFLRQLTEATRKVIFICLPNRWGMGYLVRHVARGRRDRSVVLNDSSERVVSIMRRIGWGCWKRGYFDVPPWPDIAMKKEEFLGKLGLAWLLPKKQKSDRRPLCILDYFRGDKDMERRIMKYSFLENSPAIFKKFWAHHEYLLFSPKRSAIGQRA